MSLNVKKRLSYFLSLTIIVILVSSLGSIVKELWNSSNLEDIKLFHGILMVLASYGLVSLTMVYAKFIRTTKRPIPFVSIELPNVIYDDSFVKEGHFLDMDVLEENNELKIYVVELESLVDEYVDELNKKDRDLEFEAHISDIYIRHHKNSSSVMSHIKSSNNRLFLSNSPGSESILFPFNVLNYWHIEREEYFYDHQSRFRCEFKGI